MSQADRDGAPRRINPADIAQLPLPGLGVAVSVAFSPDDRFVSFLRSPERSLERSLFLLDVATGQLHEIVSASAGWMSETSLPFEQRLLRERTGEIGLGVTSYAWAPSVNRMLVPLSDGLYAVDPPDGELHRVVDTDNGPIFHPQLSPDGAWVAFVCSGELWTAPADRKGEPRALTSGAEDGLAHGRAEYVAESDMHRWTGFWWSPDGSMLAYTEVDERHIPLYRIVHQESGNVGAEAEEAHHYPFAGMPNAKVRLGVVPAGGGSTVWIDTGDPDSYLARVGWTAAGELMVQLESRDQATLSLLRFDPSTGAAVTVHTDHSDVWINLHDDYCLLESGAQDDPGSFLWSSERSGYRHLEVRDSDGRLLRTLTSGAWMVDALAGIDEVQGLVFFSGTRDGATERHLYSVPVRGGEVVRITDEAGTHEVVVGHRGQSFVDTYSSLTCPPTVVVRSIVEGGVLQVIDDGADPRVEELALQAPELVTLSADDGTTLNALVYHPRGALPAPAAVSVYGGVQVQRVVNSWNPTVELRAQALARLGFCVLVVDNRGSARRGLRFEAAVRHALGSIEVSDQLVGVRWAVDAGLVDPARIGVYGWSYGGYLSLRCLAGAPDVFRAAVAGAPVTSWDSYESFYTECYMGTPQDNPAGYEASSAVAEAHLLDGKLLIVHGLIDENVHFRHSVRLINALIGAGKSYELLVLPEARHRPRRKEDRELIEARTLEFLTAALT